MAILAVALRRQSGKNRTFIDGSQCYYAVEQRASPAYVAVVGILLAQYSLSSRQISGFDVSADMTRNEAIFGLYWCLRSSLVFLQGLIALLYS